MSKLAILVEVWEFMLARKRYWLMPLLLVLLLVGTLMFLVEGSVIAPFIYTLF